MLTRFADPLPEEDVTQWHRRMIEAFVAKVWLYDDKLSIYYNLMGNGDELQKNDMEIAADGNKLSVRFVSGMVDLGGPNKNLWCFVSGFVFTIHSRTTSQISTKGF